MNIPDHIRYGAPELCRRSLWRPARWLIDPRWRWPEPPIPLEAQELRAIERALLDRRTPMKQEQPISTVELVLGTAALALVVGALVLWACFATALN